MILERPRQIEAKITRLFNQFSIDVENKIMFVAHLHAHPSGCEGKIYVICLVLHESRTIRKVEISSEIRLHMTVFF